MLTTWQVYSGEQSEFRDKGNEKKQDHPSLVPKDSHENRKETEERAFYG